MLYCKLKPSITPLSEKSFRTNHLSQPTSAVDPKSSRFSLLPCSCAQSWRSHPPSKSWLQWYSKSSCRPLPLVQVESDGKFQTPTKCAPTFSPFSISECRDRLRMFKWTYRLIQLTLSQRVLFNYHWITQINDDFPFFENVPPAPIISSNRFRSFTDQYNPFS